MRDCVRPPPRGTRHLADALLARVDVDAAVQVAGAAVARWEVPVPERAAVAAVAREAVSAQALSGPQACRMRDERVCAFKDQGPATRLHPLRLLKAQQTDP